jgi:hypothetical protein
MMHNNVAVHACKENASCRSISSLGGSFIQANADNMSLGAKVSMSAIIGGTAEKLGGGKFANGAVTGAYVMMFNHAMHGGDESISSQKESEQKDNSNLPSVDGVAGPWSNEYVETALEIVAHPFTQIGALAAEGYIPSLKGLGHFMTGFSVVNDSYQYFILENIGSGRYTYRLIGAATATGLTVAGSGIAPFIGSSMTFYEKAYDFIKFQYMNVEQRLNSSNWWGNHYYGF